MWLLGILDQQLGFFSCFQDLFGRSQKAEKKAKICMHTGTFVYHFKGRSSWTNSVQHRFLPCADLVTICR